VAAPFPSSSSSREGGWTGLAYLGARLLVGLGRKLLFGLMAAGQPRTENGDEAMSANVNVTNPDRKQKVLLIAANPATSPTTGWPIGFWWATPSS
jgi:hypothetical protein